MPRLARGPRLYLRAGRTDNRSGRPLPDVWCIRDGSVERSTGCGPGDVAGAEQALARYVAEKWAPPVSRTDGPSAPAEVLVDEVLAYYLQHKVVPLPDPSGPAARIKALLAWWTGKTLADVKRSECKAYVDARITQPIAQAKGPNARKVTPQGARRELEDLSAAIGYWSGEYPLLARPKVWLPDKPESARDALTRTQAARLLKAARGYRLDADGKWTRLQDSSVANRRHLARFLLVGFYTGTRPGLIPRILWTEAAAAPWVDLERGMIFRRGREEKNHKTKRRPVVRIPGRLLAHMRRWYALDLKETEARQQADCDAPPIVSVIHHGGLPLNGRIRRGFASIAADARLEVPATPHWMRHTCCTWMMENDVSVWDAAAYAGMNPTTLEKHYGHHRPSHQAKARRGVVGKLSGK